MHDKKQLNLAALKTITVYLIVGGLWILYSDKAVNNLVNSQVILTKIQTLKGWFFILTTAVLLYFLIKRYTGRIRTSVIEKQAVEKHLDFLTRYAHDIILLMDESGKILEANDRAVELYQFSREEFLKLSYSRLTKDKSEMFVGNNVEKLKNEGGLTYESLHIRKNGSTFPVEVSAKFIDTEDKNFIQCIVRDITERKLAEEQIHKLSRTVEQNPSPILITDTNGNIEYVNPSFTRLTGFGSNEVLNKNTRILKSGKNPDELYKNLWNTIKAGKEWRGEILNKKRDGEFYWVYILISPLRDRHGNVTHFISIMEDVTRQKKMTAELITAKEKAEESDRLKSEFLAQMSHEIRTPLNVILSFNSLLREELDPSIKDDYRSAFVAIDNAGKRLLRTLNHILNMAAVQTGNFEINFTQVDLSVLAEHAVKEFEFSAKSKGLNLQFNNSAEHSKIVTDDYLVSEILQNLIDNAIKYTKNGSVAVALGQNEDNDLFVRVTDTGIGISEEYLPKLFSPFSQEDSGYSRRFEGNGLGLALVKNYSDFIKARIEVSSTKGKGTSFTLIFNNGRIT